MTLRQAERITGLEIRRIPYAETGIRGRAYEALDRGVRVTSASGLGDGPTLKTLVELVYKIRSRQALERANWRCQECGRFTHLQIHHRQLRSHGRDDRLENLTVLCSVCHGEKHGTRSK